MSEFFDWLEEKERKDNNASGAAVDAHANEAEFRELEYFWEESTHAGVPEPPPLERQMAALRTRMVAVKAEEAQPQSFWARFFRPVPVFATALTVLLVGIGFWFVRPDGTVNLPAPTEYATGRGMTRTVTLADDSVVEMNAVSRLEVAHGFNQGHRNLALEGEAYFSVRKGKTPFVISTGTTTVTVVGTAFNVFARDNVVDVGVKEGVVRVSTDSAAQPLELVEGQRVRVAGGVLPGAPEDILFKQFPAWKQGGFHFRDATLAQVVDEMQRRLDVSIRLADPSLGSQEVNGLFSGNNADELIASVCALIDRSYQVEEGTFVIQ